MKEHIKPGDNADEDAELPDDFEEVFMHSFLPQGSGVKYASFLPPKPTLIALDQATINAILDGAAARRKSKREKPVSKVGHFIEYRNNNFYANEKVVDFPNPKADYVILVTALYFESDSGGFLSYDAIGKYFKKELGVRWPDGRPGLKRILNARAALYRRRRVQKNSFPRKTPDGAAVIGIARGKGLIFTNPIIA
jgi:hypothetical protein